MKVLKSYQVRCGTNQSNKLTSLCVVQLHGEQVCFLTSPQGIQPTLYSHTQGQSTQSPL